MQFLVAFLLFGAFVSAENVQQTSDGAFGYIKYIGIPEAERIRRAEEASSRIIGGAPAALGQYPFQAGIIVEVSIGDSVFNSVCGGSLISASRVLTAAHCWFDGIHQGVGLTIILGSVRLFSGGVRRVTDKVVVHPDWSPYSVRNDVLIAYLPTPAPLSAIIAPVSLPAGSELFEGESAIAVGFGITSDPGIISPNSAVNHVSVTVISNDVCALSFPFIHPSHICTIGPGGAGFCRGDSGGPLIIQRNNRQVQIGIASFLSARGCEGDIPKGYARITSFMDFINSHIRAQK